MHFAGKTYRSVLIGALILLAIIVAFVILLQMAKEGKGQDKAGYRAEFIELVNKVYKSDLAKK